MTEAGILLQKQNIPDMTRTLRIILTLCLLASAGTGAAQSIVRKSFARAAQQIALMDSLAPADRFPALLDGKDGSLVAEKAMAAAAPEEFVTALVSRTLADVPLF